jgi:transposase
MGTITLNEKQQRRAEIIARASSGRLAMSEASVLLGVCERQARRLVERYHADGLASVVHGNTARAPANKTDADVREKIRALAGPEGVYHDFNTVHLCQLLAERDQLQIGRSTLDRLLRAEGLRKPKRRHRRIFRRRERMPREGELLQIDASPHAWLEDRTPSLCLMGAIDDATGKVLHLRFWPTEALDGYLVLFREVATNHGLPMSFYHDKHTILKSPKPATIEDELAGEEPMSQAQAVLKELGVQSIPANSPQAKGRIERMWRTLQDRLLKEMRLAGVCTQEQANAFVPEFIQHYNARFAVEPADPESAWVRMEPRTDLAYYFARKEKRTVRADHTLSWLGATLQIHRRKGERSLAGERVQVHSDPEGALYLYHGKHRLTYQRLETRPAKPAPAPAPAPHTEANSPSGARRKPTDSPGTRAWLYAGT